MPVRITSKSEGFRRCGVDHTCKPTTWPDDKFTPAQLKQLQAEPMLIVDIASNTAPEPTSITQVMTLANLIREADLSTLQLARIAISDRLVEKLDVPGLLALRAEIDDALDAQGYSDPADPAPAAGAVVESEQPKPEPEKAPEQPEPPVKQDSDGVKTAVKAAKNSGK
ncbi:HI1506-related protein [Enterobacter ludwigii]|uniref:HI1506-related protein n=1 Tax=Enterobacter TaxID=547 RepID=UPI003BEF2C0C